MDKDRVKGKAKDITGRVQRQVGEWTGDEEQQIKGTGKQVEGKVQNMVGGVDVCQAEEQAIVMTKGARREVESWDETQEP